MVSFSKHLRAAGETCLGTAGAHAEDWRQGHEAELRQLAVARSTAHLAWQRYPNAAAKARLTEARKASRDAVRLWKSEWWSTRLSRLEQSARVKDAAAMFGEAQSLARLLQANGLCRRALHKGSDVELQRRRQHFHNALNVNRQFNPGVWQELPQLSHFSALVDWQAPSYEETCKTISAMHSGKAPGILGVHAELFKALCQCREEEPTAEQHLRDFHSMVVNFWQGDSSTVNIDHWHESILFILWKGKGDPQDLNTHRGVVLLDVISKVVCKLVTSRLATLAEHVCGESELAYRKGRGCSDGLFTLRRLLQEWRGTFPHGQPAEDSQLYILFVDLSKAFDGVPREDLWRLLHHHLGVPVHIISMLKSIYSGMQTRVCDPCGALSPPFDMGTGVRQGSVEGLSFFSCTLPLSFVIKVWKQRCIQRLGHEPGVSWVSAEDGSLREPARIRAASTRSHLFNNSVFADDTQPFGQITGMTSRLCLKSLHLLRDLGSELNAGKREWMEVPSITPQIDRAPLPGCRLLRILGSPIAKCAEFRYLGSLVGCDKTCGTAADAQRRCALGHAAFGKLRHVWRSSETSRSTKARLLMACVSTVLLYGSDQSWTLTLALTRKLHNAWMSFVRRALRLRFQHVRDLHLDNNALLQRLDVPSLHTMLLQRGCRWLGHVARMSPHRIPHAVLFGTIPHRSFLSATELGAVPHHYTGRARMWMQSLLGARAALWARIAQDKLAWQHQVNACQVEALSRHGALVRNYGQPAVAAVAAKVRPRRGVAPINLQCWQCGFVARNRQGLARHVNTLHPVSKQTYECPHCNKSFASKSPLTVHLNNCDMRPAPVAPAGPRQRDARLDVARPFPCSHDGCDLRFPNVSQRNRHEREQCLLPLCSFL